MSVYDLEAFHERVNYALRCLLNNRTNSRTFDTCFEMYDGDLVVTAIIRKLPTTKYLDEALAEHIGKGLAGWHETAKKYEHVPAGRLATEARKIRLARQAETQAYIAQLQNEQRTAVIHG